MKEKKIRLICAVFVIFTLFQSAAFPAYAREQVGYGPGYVNVTPPAEDAECTPGYIRGESLGMFFTTGYCSCPLCCGDNTLTYSGTVPQANHTISADLSRFPIGTKLMIGDIVYTVEDKGSAVLGDKLDIFHASHEEALLHGLQTEEVFAVIMTESDES